MKIAKKKKTGADLVARPKLKLGGRFAEPAVAPVRKYTEAEIKAMKLPPPPPDRKLTAKQRLNPKAGYRFREEAPK